MEHSVAATHVRGNKPNDVIFRTSAAAQADVKALGKDKVVNGTVGAILDEEGELVVLSSVREEYFNLSTQDLVGYAPIEGLKEYLEAVQDVCFDEFRPDGYIEAVATAGGTGGIHHLVHNYTEFGDHVLVADWHWGAYNTICKNNGRVLENFTLFDDQCKFNHPSLQEHVKNLASTQENILVILNTPGNNPTGFSISDEDWDQILAFFKELVAKGKNRIIIGIDVAYLDYSGEKKAVRRFFKKLGNLPAEILSVVCYSMSKGFTMYGQRCGAMIGISSDPEIAQEFYDVNKLTSRATWSNICRPPMRVLVNIMSNPTKLAAYEIERNNYYQLIEERAHIFLEEGHALGLPMLPYVGGFFLTIPTTKGRAICDILEKEHIYMIPLATGIRIAACGIPKAQMKGLAGKVYHAMKEAQAL